MTPEQLIADLFIACLVISFALRMAKRALFELLPAIRECQELVERVWPNKLWDVVEQMDKESKR